MESRLPDFIRLLFENPQGLPVEELASRLGITRQSVYRLREKAQALGVWIVSHRDDPRVPKGYLRLEEGGEVQLAPQLTWAELEALRSALERVEHLTPIARKALARLAQAGPARLRREPPVVYTPLADQYPEGLFDRVVAAIRGRRVCQVTYRNARGQVKTYLFDPYVIIARDPHLYLVGANHNSRRAGHDPLVELRLDQVVSLKLTRMRYPKPAFDVQEYARQRFRTFKGEGDPVRVRVRFSPEKAGFIRRTLRHPSQRVEDLPDGSVIWQVEVPLSEDLVHFVVGYGPHAQVLEPEALRKRVVAWAEGILVVYSRGQIALSPEVVTHGG
ncbi:MAG: helix-turn-helix transcriptional regulator [Thermus sp.]|uniref:helix-turn-helix transcriptional regulator n=1 Tax=Thermus sp. TaxID=275 RepID=UPI00391BA659